MRENYGPGQHAIALQGAKLDMEKAEETFYTTAEREQKGPKLLCSSTTGSSATPGVG